MTQSPRYRKCTPALWRGLCGMPLGLGLNEGLDLAARCVLSLYVKEGVAGGLLHRPPFTKAGVAEP